MASPNSIIYRRSKRMDQGRRGLEESLARMEFESDEMRDLICDSYRINLVAMVSYACEKKLSPYNYLQKVDILCNELKSRQR